MSGNHAWDLDASFAAPPPFRTSYAHLHLVPPTVRVMNGPSDLVEQLLRPPPTRSDEVANATFVHSNCGGFRGTFMERLIHSNQMTIARYGKCWHNANIGTIEPPKPDWFYGDSQANRDGVKTLLARRHPYTFALENTISPGYVTEKRYQALLGGSVPIIWEGSSEYLPDEDAAVRVHPNDTPEDVLVKLNERSYAERMAWKNRGIRREFVKTLFLSNDYLPCRICEYVAQQTPTPVVFGIPTIARKGNPDYLRRTLVSMQHHGFPIDAVYVMHANDAPHPIFESVRQDMRFHTVTASKASVRVDYTLIHTNDAEARMAYNDSDHQKQWRLAEARDWRHLMETLLRTTDAAHIGVNQDDGEWTGALPSTIDAPITSLWTGGRRVEDCHDPGGHCGMVSFVFERATLRKFLNWMAVDDRWMEKPIDWTLNDFVKEFGYKMPVHRMVEHIGKIRSIQPK